MNTFYSFTFGCRVNEAEKVALDKQLQDLGFIWTEHNPDFYIINSCAVTGKAEREVRQHIYQIKKKFPKSKIIVTGCAATNWIKNDVHVTGIDYTIENEKKMDIPMFLQKLDINNKYHIRSHMRKNVVKEKTPNQRVTVTTRYTDKFLHSGRCMVKIQDGCDRFCSYCIVPYLRGKPKSRTIEEIITHINSYIEPNNPRSNRGSRIRNLDSRLRGNDKGEGGNTIKLTCISEIILTAINTECFGKDTGETLIQLIDAILKQTTIPKISFGSIHPWSITDEFLDYYQSIIQTNRFIPFFHIPVQSGSNKILKLMNRGYKAEEMLKKFRKIKSIYSRACIGTDIIVGFPGETNKEFQETYKFLTSVPIDKIHVFRFSPRPDTAAEKLIKTYGEPTPEEKRERSNILINLNGINNSLKITT